MLQGYGFGRVLIVFLRGTVRVYKVRALLDSGLRRVLSSVGF